MAVFLGDSDPPPVNELMLAQLLDRAANLVALNWPVLSPQQKARVLSAIPREEWPEQKYKGEQDYHA